jgi:hypothetical protein
MKEIFLEIEAAATTAKTVYVPVPCRGTIAALTGVYNQETDADELLTFSRGATAVATITPTDALAAGTLLTGALDATNGQLIFDPASTTVANRVIKIGIPDTTDTAGVWSIYIRFDDSAYVKQLSIHR